MAQNDTVIYREWFEENNIFFREFKLYFGQCDIKNRMSVHELLCIASDTAVEDFSRRGMSAKILGENGIAILVSRLSFEIHEYPGAGDKLLLKTWEERPKGISLSRKYTLENDSGKSLVSGTSLWLIANPQTRRILKPSVLTMRTEPDFEIPVNCPPPAKIHPPKDMEMLGERRVGYSDIDSNGHVNNSRYAAFVMDLLPKKFQEADIKNISINYAKEALAGDVILISAAFAENGKVVTVEGRVQGQPCFEEVIELK